MLIMNAWIVTAIHLIHLRSIQILFLELRISRHHGLAPSAPACSSLTLPPWMTHWSWPKFIVCRGGKSSQSVQCHQCCLVKSSGPVVFLLWSSIRRLTVRELSHIRKKQGHDGHERERRTIVEADMAHQVACYLAPPKKSRPTKFEDGIPLR